MNKWWHNIRFGVNFWLRTLCNGRHRFSVASQKWHTHCTFKVISNLAVVKIRAFVWGFGACCSSGSDCGEEACSWLPRGPQNRERLLIWKWYRMKYAEWLRSSLSEEPEAPALGGSRLLCLSQSGMGFESVLSYTDAAVGWRGWLEANRVEQDDYWESQPHLAPLLLSLFQFSSFLYFHLHSCLAPWVKNANAKK